MHRPETATCCWTVRNPGMVYALDPTREGEEILWQDSRGRGSTNGGVQWGHGGGWPRMSCAPRLPIWREREFRATIPRICVPLISIRMSAAVCTRSESPTAFRPGSPSRSTLVLPGAGCSQRSRRVPRRLGYCLFGLSRRTHARVFFGRWNHPLGFRHGSRVFHRQRCEGTWRIDRRAGPSGGEMEWVYVNSGCSRQDGTPGNAPQYDALFSNACSRSVRTSSLRELALEHRGEVASSDPASHRRSRGKEPYGHLCASIWSPSAPSAFRFGIELVKLARVIKDVRSRE